MILGHPLGQQPCDALGLPKYTIGFTLRARAGELVTIERGTSQRIDCKPAASSQS